VTYSVRLTAEALEDLQRIEDFLVEAALRHGDPDLPRRAVAAIHEEMRILRTNPFTCRKAGVDSPERELIIPFRGSGFVALFSISSPQEVIIGAIRHQREDDYH
jgi:plasmid stabilization system protein ParE